MDVAPVNPEILTEAADGESTAVIAARVQAATNRQLQRQGKRNQALTTREIDHYCKLERADKAQLKHNIEFFHLSGRAYHRILRVARTIADLDGSERITSKHISEAIQYRRSLLTQIRPI
nr:hypothetical protein [Duganella guangzhouensis]